ncbi:hypothetical protein QR98_0006550 [Sarcoptes scabiei]|uniref:Uncharacterized protein n=1 Tax=Sarcoptes scabiei TaxID=52283 RepID=A0A131ZTY6_SARSC|nr:hypothetical protein QR98_0006550 [Sarcoptes scabiei]
MLIIILLILQSIPIRSTIKIEKKNDSQKFNEVCQTLKSSQANRSDILLIGSTMKRFIIITKNFDDLNRLH